MKLIAGKETTKVFFEGDIGILELANTIIQFNKWQGKMK